MNESRIAMVLPSLVGGGAERVGSELANHWADQGRTVTLITIDSVSGEGFPLDSRIQRVGLGLLRESRSWRARFWNNAMRVRRLRKAIRDSSAKVVVSLTDITNVTTLLACRSLDTRVIVCERTDPRQHPIGSVWSWLREKTYPHASGIVVQTRSVSEWVQSKGWNTPIYVVSNAVPDVRQKSHENPSVVLKSQKTDRIVVALGRLSREKGYDSLIEAFAKVSDQHPAWRLCIFGEGSERANLESLASRLNVSDRVSLPGWIIDVEQALRAADLFVLSSHYEGFPNSLLEAMSVGLACVSFDCDSGPREIIRHEVDGLLVPPGNVAELAAAMDRVMTDDSLRQAISTRAREVAERFSRQTYHRRWDAILRGVPPNQIDS